MALWHMAQRGAAFWWHEAQTGSPLLSSKNLAKEKILLLQDLQQKQSYFVSLKEGKIFLPCGSVFQTQ